MDPADPEVVLRDRSTQGFVALDQADQGRREAARTPTGATDRQGRISATPTRAHPAANADHD